MTEPTFTVDDVLTRVRKIKSDAGYSADNVYLWVRDAVLELFTQAPKSRKDDSGGEVSDWPAAFTAGTDTVTCRLMYLPLIVDYVLGRAFQEEGETQLHAARSTKHMEEFFKRAHWVEHGPAAFNDRTLGAMKGRA